ncbi:hypothetical protein T261_01520 [Streptomyces lydicus]|nr:hypothetical protein T261_01520 [Streptomyces lydicus]
MALPLARRNPGGQFVPARLTEVEAAIATAITDALAEPLDIAVMDAFPTGDPAKGLL